MKERPILFSAPMVRAILDGIKTQTRRVVKGMPTEEDGSAYSGEVFGPELYAPAGCNKHGEIIPLPEIYGIYDEDGQWGIKCPFGQPGDQLWVKETWRTDEEYDQIKPSELPDGVRVNCRAGFNSQENSNFNVLSRKWRSPLFMQRRFSRIVLEITDVRVERLHDISEADAMAEGCNGGHGAMPDYMYNATPDEHFMMLWESINGPGSWNDDPWVWVIEFRRLPS